MTKSYEQMHAGLFWARGKASSHLCVGCGEPGYHWAYLHNAGKIELLSPNGSPYSEDFNHYASMCLSCHRKFDIAHSPDPGAFRVVGMMSPVDPERHRLACIKGGLAAGAKVSRMRRRCGECPIESNPSGIARHHKASG